MSVITDDKDTMFTALLLIHGRAPQPPMPTSSKEDHALYGQRFHSWSKGVKQSMTTYNYGTRGTVFEFTQWYEEHTDE